MEVPGKIDARFVLFQNQLWINRQTMIAIFKDRIKLKQDMLDIMGPEHGKQYAAIIEEHQHLINVILGLDPETGSELKGGR